MRNGFKIEIFCRSGDIRVAIFERRGLFVIITIEFLEDKDGFMIMIFSSKSLGNVHLNGIFYIFSEFCIFFCFYIEPK